MSFNQMMVQGLAHGLYTGIVIITLWTVVSKKNRGTFKGSRWLPSVVLLLYLLATVGFAFNWAAVTKIYITNGQSSQMAYEAYVDPFSPPIYVLEGILAALSTILADATLIWRCWIVWDRSWRVVVIPTLCTSFTVVSKGILIYQDLIDTIENISGFFAQNSIHWGVLYSSLILATMLWCTLFIIYRILTVTASVAAGMRSYHRVIEVMVESASLYSAVLIVLLVLEVRNDLAVSYVIAIATSMRGIMPAMQIGRVAAGHARPDNSWSGSSASESIHFRTSSASEQSQDGMSYDGTALARSRSDLEDGLGNSARS
ncbi:hypothetical protein ARMSODRAFT_604793 [Armillaria solidipes]|uniref:Uncharacterized protein n=1 Tax=Armillaria solidipes TaxID=1076256 RepID=A0A2H3B5W1_9AGAR|nr:hypothetical protein ARMSODRAFT_604793 [Armillaria solidipes]